jgi:hypothetical protein
MKAERASRFALVGPPPALKLRSLLETPPEKKRRKTFATPLCRGLLQASTDPPASSSRMPLPDAVQPQIPAARAQSLKLGVLLQPPLGFAGLQLSPTLRVYFSAAAWAKHRRTSIYLGQQGRLTSNPADATHRVLAGKAERAAIAKDSIAGWFSMSELLQQLRMPIERAIA